MNFTTAFSTFIFFIIELEEALTTGTYATGFRSSFPNPKDADEIDNYWEFPLGYNEDEEFPVDIFFSSALSQSRMPPPVGSITCVSGKLFDTSDASEPPKCIVSYWNA